ncbi:MAG: TIGR03435 family protein [Terriglobia bacterium]
MIPKYLSAIWAATTPAMGTHLRRSTLFAIVTGPAVFGLLNVMQIRAQSPPATVAPQPSFEVASVKRDRSGGPGIRIMLPTGRFTATNVTAKMLIEFAYNGNQAGLSLRDDQVSGGPSWISSEKYDIDAKVEDSLVKEQEEKLPFDQWATQVRLMVQSLLTDRFKLKVSHMSKELPVYGLVIAKNGSKLTLSTVPPLGPPGANPPGSERPKGPMMRMGRGEITGITMSAGALADVLSRQPELEGREVIDETALKGNYDFTLHWTPDQSQAAMFKGPAEGKPGTDNAPPPESSGPSLFTAIQEQLGLKLESKKGQVEIVVIDHVEQPSED